MKKIIVMFLLLSLWASCRKEADYKHGKFHTAIVTPYDMEITDVEVEDWKVGPGFRTKISKGIQVVFNFPILSSEAVNEIYKEYQINGWVIRVIKDGPKGRRILGYLYYPLKHSEQGRLSFGTQQIKSGAVRIYYAAASMSTRFRKLMCPAFEHDLRITESSLVPGDPASRFLIGSSEQRRIGGKIERFSLRPAIFNAEMSMRATYSIEIAFFNIEKQEQKSNFVKVSGDAVVSKEERILIRGCEGERVPPRDSSESGGGFHFGG